MNRRHSSLLLCSLLLLAASSARRAHAQPAEADPIPADTATDLGSETDTDTDTEVVDTDGADTQPAPAPQPAPVPAAEPAVEDEPEEEAAPFPLGVTASIFTRPEIRTGYNRLGQADTDFVRYRFRVGLELQPLDLGRVTVGARFVPQAAGFWSSGATLTDPGLGIHESVLLLSTEKLRVEIGRFEMAYGEELLIGPVAWHQVGRAFDGARAHVALGGEGAYLDIFGTQLVENLDTDFAWGDVLFFGVYAGLGPMLADNIELDVYFLSLVRAEADDPDPTLATPRSHVGTLGGRFRLNGESLDLRVEAGMQIHSVDGGPDTQIAYQADAEVGLKLTPEYRISLEALVASGGNGDRVAAWNQLFPTAHKFLGLMDIIGGRSNIISAVVHNRLKLRDDLWVSLDLHLFGRPEGANSGYTGLEGNLGMGWLIGRGLSLRGGYGLFAPAGDAFGTARPAHFGELELRYTR